ncbi:MAG: transporter substrate-binding domain-containing protein [Oscillospiraceae bacterium]|jgi:polar amino acid transport system substrate-binding protein|nr:transporter substrate-binding domain-containing protein [Oscillospiraceae bacterium]MCI1991087.1 transporter substrate-binding domain-containing protein [Oscillospiraceae bacterium]
MKKFAKMGALAAAGALLLNLAACSISDSGTAAPSGGASSGTGSSSISAGTGESETLKKVKSGGVLKVGSSGAVPFAYIDTKTNTFAGVDADITSAVAKKLGISKVEMVKIPYNNLLMELAKGSIDLVSSGMYCTAARQKQALFSNVYYKEGESILIPKDSPIKSADDFKGKKISVNQGTAFQKQLEKWVQDGKLGEVVVSTTLNDALLSVTSGKADAVMADQVVGAYMLKQDNSLGLKMLSPYTMESSGNVCAAFGKDDPAFVKEWNDALDGLKKDGTVLKILEKYGLSNDSFVSVEDGRTVNPAS